MKVVLQIPTSISNRFCHTFFCSIKNFHFTIIFVFDLQNSSLVRSSVLIAWSGPNRNKIFLWKPVHVPIHSHLMSTSYQTKSVHMQKFICWILTEWGTCTMNSSSPGLYFFWIAPKQIIKRAFFVWNIPKSINQTNLINSPCELAYSSVYRKYFIIYNCGKR